MVHPESHAMYEWGHVPWGDGEDGDATIKQSMNPLVIGPFKYSSIPEYTRVYQIPDGLTRQLGERGPHFTYCHSSISYTRFSLFDVAPFANSAVLDTYAASAS